MKFTAEYKKALKSVSGKRKRALSSLWEAYLQAGVGPSGIEKLGDHYEWIYLDEGGWNDEDDEQGVMLIHNATKDTFSLWTRQEVKVLFPDGGMSGKWF